MTCYGLEPERAKMRQQLQVLRDNGVLQFTDRGRYRVLQFTDRGRYRVLSSSLNSKVGLANPC